jgi:microcin C transport system permease protein
VLQLIKEKLPVSMSLGIWMMLITYLISIPLGIRKAVQDGSRFDTWTSAVIIVGFAIPGFLFAILLIILFSGGSFWSIFPLRGLTSDGWSQFPWYWKIIDYFWHMTLPLISMVLGAFATMTLLTKNSFLDEIRKQYVMTARAKGCNERQVLYNHIFRNAMLIVIAGFPGAFIHAFFSGSLLIETIFSLDGLGLLGFESVLNRDYPVVFGTLFIFSLVGLVVNLCPIWPICGSIRGSTLRREKSDDHHRARARRNHHAVAARRSRAAIASPARHLAAQPASLAELQVQSPWLLVVLDFLVPVLHLAVRRGDRQ